MLNHRNGIEATKKKSMQPPWVLFIRRQSDESLGHSGRGKTFKMGEKSHLFKQKLLCLQTGCSFEHMNFFSLFAYLFFFF